MEAPTIAHISPEESARYSLAEAERVANAARDEADSEMHNPDHYAHLDHDPRGAAAPQPLLGGASHRTPPRGAGSRSTEPPPPTTPAAASRLLEPPPLVRLVRSAAWQVEPRAQAPLDLPSGLQVFPGSSGLFQLVRGETGGVDPSYVAAAAAAAAADTSMEVE